MTTEVNAQFIQRLDAARTLAGVPFFLNSALRSYERNKAVGGKPNSSHLRGLAADIVVTDSRMRYKIVKGLLQAGFTRIGIGKNFIHVDADTSLPQQVMWVYPKTFDK